MSPELITRLVVCLAGSGGIGSVVKIIVENDEIGPKLFTGFSSHIGRPPGSHNRHNIQQAGPFV